MERLEKGKGKEWSIEKRELKVMKGWEVSLERFRILSTELIRGFRLSQKEWSKRNVNENGGELEFTSQDGDLSENGVALSKSVSALHMLITATQS